MQSQDHNIAAHTVYSSSKELLLYVRVDLSIRLPAGQFPLDMVGSLLSQWVILRGLLLRWEMEYSKLGMLRVNTPQYLFLCLLATNRKTIVSFIPEARAIN